MHFHLPRPIHGWREFLGEVGIIVFGILIALGAEQAVEAVHWHKEVADSREALRVELDHDLGAVAYRLDQQQCIARRMDAVDAWVASLRAGKPIHLSARIGGPDGYSIHSSVWEIVKSGQAAAHMPLRDKLDYAQIYDVLQNISNMEGREFDAWRALAEGDGARSLDDADLRKLHLSTRIIVNVSKTYANNLDEISGPLRRLGLKADRLKVYDPGRRRQLCDNILPKG